MESRTMDTFQKHIYSNYRKNVNKVYTFVKMVY
jgi:hypothetical protein